MRTEFLHSLHSCDLITQLRINLRESEAYVDFVVAERETPMDAETLKRLHHAEHELEAQRNFHKAAVSKVANFSKFCDEQERRRQQAVHIITNVSKHCHLKKRVKTIFETVVHGQDLNRDSLREEIGKAMSESKALCDAVTEAALKLQCDQSPLPSWKAELSTVKNDLQRARHNTACCPGNPSANAQSQRMEAECASTPSKRTPSSKSGNPKSVRNGSLPLPRGLRPVDGTQRTMLRKA